MLVNSWLQSVAYPKIFWGGGCISLESNPLGRVGVYAVRQNPVLYPNLLATLEGMKLQPFVPQKACLLVFNMGNERGMLWQRNFLWEGRLAFFLKDYVDRKFLNDGSPKEYKCLM